MARNPTPPVFMIAQQSLVRRRRIGMRRPCAALDYAENRIKTAFAVAGIARKNKTAEQTGLARRFIRRRRGTEALRRKNWK